MEIKICTKCGQEKPAMNDYFYNHKGHKLGLQSLCKICKQEDDRQYYVENKERLIEKARQWRLENKEHKAEQAKQFRTNNKERLAEISRQWYINNKKHVAEYQAKNKDAITKRNKQWILNNKEHVLKRGRIYWHDYIAKKKSLPSTLTINEWELIKKHFDNKCCYCGRESLLTQEHFLALNKGGEYSYSNIIPACKNCNSSKRDKSFFEWYPKYKHYSKKREQKILKFLNYKDNIQQLSLII